MDNDQLTITLGVIAGVIQLAGYGIYLRVSKETNIGSWAIWTVGAVLDVVSYMTLTGDWVKNILPAVCALACIITFGYLLLKRRFGPADKEDYFFFGLDVLITFVWWRWTSAAVANLLYQGSTLASFYPIIKGQLKGSVKEHPLPWLLWTVAYVIFTATVALRLNHWEELAYPLVHVVTHFAVLVIAIIKLRPSR